MQSPYPALKGERGQEEKRKRTVRELGRATEGDGDEAGVEEGGVERGDAEGVADLGEEEVGPRSEQMCSQEMERKGE